MADTNIQNDTVVIKDNKSIKQEKIEKKNRKYQLKLEANRLKQVKKLEAKKAKLSIKLNKVQNPKRKSAIADKIDKLTEKLNQLNDPAKANVKRPVGLVIKTWSKGLSKEASRITWSKKSAVLKDFITVIIVCAFLGLVFFGIDMIIISLR